MAMGAYNNNKAELWYAINVTHIFVYFYYELCVDYIWFVSPWAENNDELQMGRWFLNK